ncbi:ATP-binding protein [Streptomyces sp. NPDC101209]|uniref:ATP-binding protein n=1 Tax=Streptomyces sp. NPDC101209 TaxID=3366129 RepID=UPI0037F7023A
MQMSFALEAEGAGIARAREAAADFLMQMQAAHGVAVPAHVREVTQLVVSELVTNARKYAPGPVLLQVRVAAAGVEVVVWDSDPVLPVARATDALRVGQHGLEIVTALTQSLAAERVPGGKRVSARIANTGTEDDACGDR